MKKALRLFIAFSVFELLFLLILSTEVFASSWYFPLEKYSQRQKYKKFGQYISPEFYLGQESLYPNKFLGYHAGDDLEILPNELNQKVPVYAISGGIITYFGKIQGYGGLILEQLPNQNLTVLYGHLNLQEIILQVGDKVSPGQKIAYLGHAFSTDSGGERKHLHFGIYRGNGLYFKGYETDLNILNSKWLNPDAFLKDKINKNIPETQSAVSNIPQKTSPKTLLNFFYVNLSRLINFLYNYIPLNHNK